MQAPNIFNSDVFQKEYAMKCQILFHRLVTAIIK